MRLSLPLLALLVALTTVSASPWDSFLNPLSSYRTYIRKLFGKSPASAASTNKPVYSAQPPAEGAFQQYPGMGNGYIQYPVSSQDYAAAYQQFAQQAAQLQQQQPSAYYPSGTEGFGQQNFAYGTYRGISQAQQQQQNQETASNNDASPSQGGGQQSYAYPTGGFQQPGHTQQQYPGSYYPRGQMAQYIPQQQAQQQAFQSDESANQVAYQSPETQGQGAQSQLPLADQEGIYAQAIQQYNQQQQQQYQPSGDSKSNYQFQSSAYPGFQDQMNAAASSLQPQIASQDSAQAASGYRPVYYRPAAGYPRPGGGYGSSNPQTIDVHQVLDQFLRSNGLSPQGDAGDLAMAGSEKKSLFSIKKLYSYPFYASFSGDKEKGGGYANSIRRQSVAEEPPKPEALIQTRPKSPTPSHHVSRYLPKPAASVQKAPASQPKVEPATPKQTPTTTTVASPSSPAPSDDETQFIAKQAQVLQDFLASGGSTKAKTASANQQSHHHYYYQPPNESAPKEASSDESKA